MAIIAKDGWTLIHKDQPVLEGSQLQCSRGETYEIVGGRPPHKEGSTGRVWVKPPGSPQSSTREYFPGVVDCHWTQQPNNATAN